MNIIKKVLSWLTMPGDLWLDGITEDYYTTQPDFDAIRTHDHLNPNHYRYVFFGIKQNSWGVWQNKGEMLVFTKFPYNFIDVVGVE